MKEGSPKSPNSSSESEKKTSKKTKSNKLGALTANAVKSETKEAEKAEVKAPKTPKVPLHELFVADKTTGKEDQAPAKKASETELEASKPDKESAGEDVSQDDALELPAAEPEEADAQAEDGLLVINHEADTLSSEEYSGEIYELTEDEPAPAAAPPIMYDIPLRGATEATPAPVTAEAGDGGEPPVLPPFEAAQAGTPEEPEWTPLVEASQPAETEEIRHEAERHFYETTETEPITKSSKVSTFAEKYAAEKEKSDTEYYAEKRGRRGTLGAVVISYLFGRHRGRVRAEKAAAKELKKQDEQIEKLESEQKNAEVKKNVLSTTVEQLQVKAHGLEEKVKGLLSRKPESAPEENPEISAAQAKAVEKRLEVMKAVNAEKLKQAAELSPEDQELTEDAYAAPEGRRYETSAWHRYEVDKQTGRLVEDSDLEYGQEFKREQKQELLQPEPVATGAAFQIGHAVVLSSDAGNNQTAVVDPVGALTQASLQPEFTPYQPPRTNIQPKEMVQEVVSYARQPIIWLAAAVIVVLLFAFGILH